MDEPLDLSAFNETRNVGEFARSVIDASERDQVRTPQRNYSPSPNRDDMGEVRRGRSPIREARAKRGPGKGQGKGLSPSLGAEGARSALPGQALAAKQDHLQGTRPSDTRKEPLRQAAHCKERPSKTKGKGGSRPFVPWCDRKR